MPEPPPELDPSLIDQAPLDLDFAGDASAAEKEYREIIGSLATDLEETQAELDNLRGKKTIDEVRAELIQPYSNKVFWFVVWYCGVIGALVIGDGFGAGIFNISETVLGIIAGSTAVSVIGLIGMVITGLFGIRK